MKELYIVGAGTYGEVMYELAEACGYEVIAFYDEDESKIGTQVMDANVIGKFSELTDADICGKNFVVAIGNNKVRCDIMTDINAKGGITPRFINMKSSNLSLIMRLHRKCGRNLFMGIIGEAILLFRKFSKYLLTNSRKYDIMYLEKILNRKFSK